MAQHADQDSGKALTDPNDDRGRIDREQDRIDAADMAEADRDALGKWRIYLENNVSLRYASQQLLNVREAAEIAEDIGAPPLSAWDEADFKEFYNRLSRDDVPDEYGPDGGWKEGTLRNKKQHLKNFHKWLGREWAGDIEIGAAPSPTVEPDDLLRPDELADLWDATDHARDEALVALPLCTWQRNAVVRSFRVGDVHLNGGGEAWVRIFRDASGRKGATGKKPLSWAAGPLKRWLDKHPGGDDEDAPLLAVIANTGTAEPGDPLQNNETLNQRLRFLAEKAGLDRDRWDRNTGRKERTIRAHLLRYTGATRAAKSDDFGESTVKKWGNWTQSSEQLDRYIQLTDDDVLASWAAAHDVSGEAFESDRPEFGTCERCSAPVEEWHATCPTCGHDVGEEAPETVPRPEVEQLRERVEELEAEREVQQDVGASKALADGEEITEADLEAIANDDALLGKLIELRSE